ncbi:hypothetical protein bcgnr5390_15800 [Bacillus luti]|nr:hypothetical protein BC2903_45780 [Bacillus cereus]
MSKYNSTNIDPSAVAKVAYIWGFYQNHLKEEYIDDLDFAYDYWVKVAVNWANKIDIQSDEELFYVSRYAERVIPQKYGKQ